MNIFARRFGTGLLLTSMTVAAATSVVIATDVFLLVFLAILLSVFIYRCSKALENLSSLPYKANFTLIVIGMLLVICGVFALFGFQTAKQMERTAEQLNASYSQVGSWLEDYPLLRRWLRQVPFSDQALTDGRSNPSQSKTSSEAEQAGRAARAQQAGKSGESEISSADKAKREKSTTKNESDSAAETAKQASKAALEAAEKARQSGNGPTAQSMASGLMGMLGNAFATTFGAVANTVFVFFISVFLAFNPSLYRSGVIALVPASSRNRADEILTELEETLFGWLRGRGVTMLITGIGTGLMLWLLGVPLAFTLGLLTGALTFIPTIGAILALLVSAIVAASQGITTVLLVILLYVVFQLLESNVISPLVQEHSTSVPPAILLSSQLLMGILTGFLGVLVAVPLVASVMVLVREIYVKDILRSGTYSR